MIHLKVNVDKYKIVYTEVSHLRANLKHSTADYSTPTDAVDCFRQAFMCLAVSPTQQIAQSFVTVLSISYNFLSAHVLLTSFEN